VLDCFDTKQLTEVARLSLATGDTEVTKEDFTLGQSSTVDYFGGPLHPFSFRRLQPFPTACACSPARTFYSGLVLLATVLPSFALSSASSGFYREAALRSLVHHSGFEYAV
jgi:hypothetical protein